MMRGQLRRNWNAANARIANEPFVALFDGPGGVDNAVKEVRIIDETKELRDRAEAAEAEIERLRVELAAWKEAWTRDFAMVSKEQDS
jgi:hypothetical protein